MMETIVFGMNYKENKRLFYVNLLTSGKLNVYLADINEQADELFFGLVMQFSDKEGIITLGKRYEILIPFLFPNYAVEFFTNLWYNHFISEKQIGIYRVFN